MIIIGLAVQFRFLSKKITRLINFFQNKNALNKVFLPLEKSYNKNNAV